MEGLQASGFAPSLDSSRAETCAEKLPPGDDSMLARSERA
jgi:hypothetical protein